MLRWLNRAAALVGLSVLCLGIIACASDDGGQGATASPTATPTPTETPSPTPTTRLPVGLEALTDLLSLAELRPPGVRAGQVSSYDRSGGNSDLGVGPDTSELLRQLGLEPAELDNSYLYRDGDRYVIFDSVGPGVVYRIWMTGLDGLFDGELGGAIAFELDGEPVSRLELTRADFFRGDVSPFLHPLAGDLTLSSGGFYNVVPIPYADRLRILTSVIPNWVNITYLQLPPGRPVESFDPSIDAVSAAETLAATGTDPKGIAPTIEAEVPLAVQPGATQEIWQHGGPGTVLGLELLAPAGASIPLDLRLQATWDGASQPQVDVPLDELFGAALGEAAQGFALGREGDRFYCYFPMPFLASARIELRNDGPGSFTGWQLHLTAGEGVSARRPGYFTAFSDRATLEPDGNDYTLLDASGTGHVVAVILTAGCGRATECELSNIPGLDGAHLEGDERIHIDGSRYPQMHGTGLEDFFNGGFYFIRGPFALPTHGNPSQPQVSERRPGINLRSSYRLLLGDAVPFYAGIRLTIEHGPTNDVPAEMSSTVLYYAISEATLIETDRIDLAAGDSESAHDLVVTDRSDVALTSSFRGDASDLPFSASGFTAARTGFRVAVDAANRGVRLRRLADIGSGGQSAAVFVDGQPAGTWYSSDINPELRWADLDFDLPEALTAGKSFIDVDLDATASPAPWTAFGYQVLCYRDAAGDEG